MLTEGKVRSSVKDIDPNGPRPNRPPAKMPYQLHAGETGPEIFVPNHTRQLDRIEQKLGLLIAALADDNDEPEVGMDGSVLMERDENQPL